MTPGTYAHGSLPLVLVSVGLLGLGACGGDGPTQPFDNLPSPTGQSLWDFLQEEEYQENWAFWPGKGEKYAALEPHALVTTYVNHGALQDLQAGATTLTPGSIVLMENYDPAEPGTLVSITTMYKASGFDAEHNNWFWLKNDPSGVIEAQGKIGECIDCHSGAVTSDYLWTPLR